MAGSRSSRNSNERSHELDVAPRGPSRASREIGGHRHRVGGGDGAVAHLDVEGAVVGPGVTRIVAHAADGSVKTARAATRSGGTVSDLYDIPIHTLQGEPSSLAPYKGKALLLVNVASRCGLTPQYTGLQKLQDTYGEKGFSVLGFPCNQFLEQEPGTADEIAEFCSVNYGVTFPLFEKIEVNGPGRHRSTTSSPPRPTPRAPPVTSSGTSRSSSSRPRARSWRGSGPASSPRTRASSARSKGPSRAAA